MTRKIIKVGDSAAITLPKTLLKKLGLSAGDSITLEDTDHGALIRPAQKITARDKRVAKLTNGFIDRYRSDLEALARK